MPDYLRQQFHCTNELLLSGAAKIRNREAAHGTGPAIKEIPEHLASYTLHLTATNLLFLMQCNEGLITTNS